MEDFEAANFGGTEREKRERGKREREREMVNVFELLKPLFHGLMKLAGLRPQRLEIEPGTIMNIWVPKQCVLTKTKSHHHQTNYIPPNKPSVLLLHSFAADGVFTWLFQVLALTGKYSVYVPDLLFFGGSITDKPERSANFQAEFLVKGMQILGVKKCTVVGLSYGGMIGFRMAKLDPGLVEFLVASATVIELTESISFALYGKLGLSTWSDLLLPDSVDGVKELFSVGSHQLPQLPEFIYRCFLEDMFNNRKERAQLLEALVIRDEDASDTNYRQKIHMLWGDDDKIFSLELAHKMREQLGEKATLEYIEKAGHLVPLERPFAYNQRLKQILASFHKYDEPQR